MLDLTDRILRRVATTVVFVLAMGTAVPASAMLSEVVYDQPAGAQGYGAHFHANVNSGLAHGVMPSDFHVHSVYVTPLPNPGYMSVEVGWCWHGQSDKPTPFKAVTINSNQVQTHKAQFSVPSTHDFSVRRLPGTYTWRFYMDGVSVFADEVFPEGLINRGYAISSSERTAVTSPWIPLLPISNWSHAFGLQKSSATGVWSDWAGLQDYRSVFNYEPDPQYVQLKVSNTEWKCVAP